MMGSTAVQLLRRVVKVDGVTRAALADALCMTSQAVDLYISGNVPIPRLIQVALATFVIEQVPSLAGLGYQLRDQVRATIAYEAGDTVRRERW